MRRRLAAPMSTGRVLAIVLVTCLGMGAANLAFNAYVFRSLCGLIVAQAQAYREVPPSSPLGERAAQEWAEASRVICRV